MELPTGWTRVGRKLLCCSGFPRGREEGREMLPGGRREVGSKCRKTGRTKVPTPRTCFRSPTPPSADCSSLQSVFVAASQPVCYFSASTWCFYQLQFKIDSALTHLRIVAWLPGLVREHWPKGKVDVISMISSSSSSSTSCTVSELGPADLYERRAWGSPACMGCRWG